LCDLVTLWVKMKKMGQLDTENEGQHE
jgi:hypothetical protein